MNSRIGLLSIVLFAQLVVVAMVWMLPSDERDERTLLIGFDPEQVNRMTLSDGENRIEVTLVGGNWQTSGVPADADKISGTLEKLVEIDAPWPVATSAESAERFEVSEGNYQRHITLYGVDEVLGELYLGTSPGYQRVHARRAGSEEVFSVGLSNYELGVSADAWVDKSILALASVPSRIELLRAAGDGAPAGDDQRVEILESTDEGWLYNGAAADQDAAGTYANRFTTLRVLGLADVAAQPVEQWGIAVSNTSENRLLVVSLIDEEDYLIQEKGADVRYRLATYIAEQILMNDADFSPKELHSEMTPNDSPEKTGG